MRTRGAGRLRRWLALVAVTVLALSGPAGAASRPSGRSTWRVDVTGSGTPGMFLRSVSCPNARSCVAVGWFDDGPPVAVSEVLDGTTWRQVPVPGGNGVELLSVACPSPGLCLAVGYALRSQTVLPGVAFRLAHDRWTRLALPSPVRPGVTPLEAVSCASARSCEAVGAYDQEAGTYDAGVYDYALAWDGTRFALQRVPHRYDDALLSVSCAAPGQCVAVGNRGAMPDRILIERLTAGRWSVIPATSLTKGLGLLSVSCPSVSSCVAVGGTSTSPAASVVEVLAGGRWTLLHLPGSTWPSLGSPAGRAAASP